MNIEEQYNQQALILQEQIGALVVVDDMSFKKTESLEQIAKDNIKAIKEHLTPQIEEANRKHKKLTALRKRLCSPHENVAQEARRKCIEYVEAEKRKAELEAEKLAEKARKDAEDAQIAEAERLSVLGQSSEAEAVLEAPVVPVAPIPDRVVPKVKGSREKWVFEIVDINIIPRDYMIPDEKAIGAIVRARKGNTNIPGIKVNKIIV